MRLASGFAILYLAFTSLFMFTGQAVADRLPVRIWVWEVENLEQHFTVLQKHPDGPCGVTAEIEVTQVPDPLVAHKSVGFDLVVEYRQDEIVNRWATPANSWVAAIQGDPVYSISAGDLTGSFKIGVDGSIEVTGETVSKGEWIKDCPLIVKFEFPGSDFLRCVAYNDLESGETRTIGFEGTCT
ncbi:MAG: hypothetical protein HKN28_18730 [Alphaproteobacteria bacterium]|nr:hypothetical protein [Alphaproteobacteria bacterium]